MVVVAALDVATLIGNKTDYGITGDTRGLGSTHSIHTNDGLRVMLLATVEEERGKIHSHG